jgi:hypothetical protein
MCSPVKQESIANLRNLTTVARIFGLVDGRFRGNEYLRIYNAPLSVAKKLICNVP